MYKGFFKKSLIYFFLLFIFLLEIKAATITFYAKAPVSLSELSSIFSEGIAKSLASAFNDFQSGPLNTPKGLESVQDYASNNFSNDLGKQNLQDPTCWGLRQFDNSKEILSV